MRRRRASWGRVPRRSANGVAALRGTAWPVWRMRRAAASRDARDERRIPVALDGRPPDGYARWNGTLLAKHLGDISKHQIWRVLREHEISLARRRSWCIST